MTVPTGWKHPTWRDESPILIGQRGLFEVEGEDGVMFLVDFASSLHPDEISIYNYGLEVSPQDCVAPIPLLNGVDPDAVTVTWEYVHDTKVVANATVGESGAERTGPDPVTAIREAVTAAAVRHVCARSGSSQ